MAKMAGYKKSGSAKMPKPKRSPAITAKSLNKKGGKLNVKGPKAKVKGSKIPLKSGDTRPNC